jgi:hypothetical protein
LSWGYELDNEIQKRLDLGQSFQRSAEHHILYQKCAEHHTPPQQKFTELCRNPVENISKSDNHHAFCMMIS